jgi:DNA invertase Pin-like site-specific DNA recombinase
MAKTLLAIAKIENNRRKERQKQGILAAQKKGKYQGRKTVINKTLIQKVKYLKEVEELAVTDISKLTGVSCPTIYKVLKEHLGYVSNRLIKPTALKTEKIKIKGRSTLKKCSIEQGYEMVTARNK